MKTKVRAMLANVSIVFLWLNFAGAYVAMDLRHTLRCLLCSSGSCLYNAACWCLPYGVAGAWKSLSWCLSELLRFGRTGTGLKQATGTDR